MPVLDGRNPVSRLLRDGLQSGDWVCALANSSAWRAPACHALTIGAQPVACAV